ncbi:MAG: hypothetical protein IKM02_00565 [Clostridia bacterium]|nr:hypothetical protein [Clostridia bacterium]
MLHFSFPKGIWILDSHEANDTGKVVKSDAAKVRYELLYPEDDVTVYVYKTKTADKSIRKEWKLKKLMQKINDGECELEFLYQYKCGNGRIILCALHSPEKPYYRECELRMLVSDVTYLWNDLCPESEW